MLTGDFFFRPFSEFFEGFFIRLRQSGDFEKLHVPCKVNVVFLLIAAESVSDAPYEFYHDEEKERCGQRNCGDQCGISPVDGICFFMFFELYIRKLHFGFINVIFIYYGCVFLFFGKLCGGFPFVRHSEARSRFIRYPSDSLNITFGPRMGTAFRDHFRTSVMKLYAVTLYESGRYADVSGYQDKCAGIVNAVTLLLFKDQIIQEFRSGIDIVRERTYTDVISHGIKELLEFFEFFRIGGAVFEKLIKIFFQFGRDIGIAQVYLIHSFSVHFEFFEGDIRNAL